MIRPADTTQQIQPVRCAVYTRKSTDEGLDQDFNTLDAQREAGEAFVASRKPEGWLCLPERYDDGGFTGGNLDRPALQRLIRDIEAGRIDCVVVYKVDRLSRSLLDFARLVEIFDRHQVTFVSVTQPISTADSTGRLMLNVLLSFAQFEREMIADRTRDKMSAARRRGRWTGGIPVLGYEVHPDGGKLVVNEEEAVQVRAIFALYLEKQSMLAVAEELNRRGWTTKRYVAGTGKANGGSPWNKTNLHRLLSNPVYTGRVLHRGKVYPGDHQGIITRKTWDRAQALLQENRQNGGARAKNRYGFLLRGLLRCTACGAAYSPSTTRKNGRVYRYYVCTGAQKTGWHSCPRPSIPAQQIEDLIVGRIRAIGQDAALVRETVRQVQLAKRKKKPALVAEQKRLTRQRAQAREEIRGLLDAVATGTASGPSLTDRLSELEEQLATLDHRLAEIREEIAALEATTVDQAEIAKALSLFDPIWEVLFPAEQERIIQLLIDRIEYDGKTGELAIKFAPTGIKLLAGEIEAAEGAA